MVPKFQTVPPSLVNSNAADPLLSMICALIVFSLEAVSVVFCIVVFLLFYFMLSEAFLKTKYKSMINVNVDVTIVFFISRIFLVIIFSKVIKY